MFSGPAGFRHRAPNAGWTDSENSGCLPDFLLLVPVALVRPKRVCVLVVSPTGPACLVPPGTVSVSADVCSSVRS